MEVGAKDVNEEDIPIIEARKNKKGHIQTGKPSLPRGHIFPVYRRVRPRTFADGQENSETDSDKETNQELRLQRDQFEISGIREGNARGGMDEYMRVAGVVSQPYIDADRIDTIRKERLLSMDAKAMDYVYNYDTTDKGPINATFNKDEKYFHISLDIAEIFRVTTILREPRLKLEPHYYCPYCTEFHPSAVCLIRHCDDKHDPKLRFRCKRCHKHYQTQQRFYQHFGDSKRQNLCTENYVYTALIVENSPNRDGWVKPF